MKNENNVIIHIHYNNFNLLSYSLQCLKSNPSFEPITFYPPSFFVVLWYTQWRCGYARVHTMTIQIHVLVFVWRKKSETVKIYNDEVILKISNNAMHE